VYIAPQADTKNFPGGKGGKRLLITTDDVERLLLRRQRLLLLSGLQPHLLKEFLIVFFWRRSES
jgi:hypothetical protein